MLTQLSSLCFSFSLSSLSNSQLCCLLLSPHSPPIYICTSCIYIYITYTSPCSHANSYTLQHSHVHTPKAVIFVCVRARTRSNKHYDSECHLCVTFSVLALMPRRRHAVHSHLRAHSHSSPSPLQPLSRSLPLPSHTPTLWSLFLLSFPPADKPSIQNSLVRTHGNACVLARLLRIEFEQGMPPSSFSSIAPFFFSSFSSSLSSSSSFSLSLSPSAASSS